MGVRRMVRRLVKVRRRSVRHRRCPDCICLGGGLRVGVRRMVTRGVKKQTTLPLSRMGQLRKGRGEWVNRC